jgi:FKBP-type peptidyl-prolyl cis-trans isomerase SlyD
MKIENNKLVSVIYELKEGSDKGRVIETIEESRPLSFIFGTGRLLPSFESNLGSLSKGDNFGFLLSAGDAYGERREEMIINVPISVFQTDGKVDENICYVGNIVPMMDTSGNPLEGIINEISETSVRMDFNHPMAGADLWFTGSILDVREPSEAEISETNKSCSGCGSDGNSSCSGNC